MREQGKRWDEMRERGTERGWREGGWVEGKECERERKREPDKKGVGRPNRPHH